MGVTILSLSSCCLVTVDFEALELDLLAVKLAPKDVFPPITPTAVTVEVAVLVGRCFDDCNKEGGGRGNRLAIGLSVASPDLFDLSPVMKIINMESCIKRNVNHNYSPQPQKYHKAINKGDTVITMVTCSIMECTVFVSLTCAGAVSTKWSSWCCINVW